MSRKTKPGQPFYRSQATQERCQLHSPNRLYVSGANVASPPKLSQKLMHQNIGNNPRLANKYERAIDGITTTTNFKKQSSEKQQVYGRKKYVQDVRWQSPSKVGEKKEGFKSIIEEINENNDKALEQLDDDIRRIKNNLVKVQEQKAIDKKNQQNELLFQEIQLLQEQNERLRTKNLEMIQQKKKLAQTIEKYQAFLQQQREKQVAVLSVKHSNQQKTVQQFLIQRLNSQEKFRQKQIQNQKLKFEVEKLNKALDASNKNKRQVIQAEEIARLNKKIQELQRELTETTLSFQQNLKGQLQKKDKYYLNLLEMTRNKSENSFKMLQNSHKQELNAESEDLLKQKERQFAKLKHQMNILVRKEEQQRKKHQKYESQLAQLKNKIQNLTNENQFLNFACKQATDRFNEKDQQRAQLQKKFNSLQTQYKKVSSELQSIDLKSQQQKKRYSLLQQLYDRLERQSQNLGSQAQNHIYIYKKAICDYQQEVNQYKYQLACSRKNCSQLQQKLEQSLKQNEKILLENRNKNEEMLSLKKQKIILLNHRESFNRVQEYQSPPKYEIRQRFLSGQARSTAQLIKEKEKEKQKHLQYKKLEKELENMIQDLRLQKEKDRHIYKQKEKGFKAMVQTQKKMIEQSNQKIQTLKSDTQKMMFQKLSKEEELLQIVRKKEASILNNQLKLNEMQLKIAKLENQAKHLKQVNDQYKNNFSANQSKLKKQLEQKNKDFKDKSLDFLQKIMKQLKKVEEASLQTSATKVLTFYPQELNEFSSFIDYRKLSEFNLLIDNINQKFVSLIKKTRQFEKKYGERNNYQKCKNDFSVQDFFKAKFYQSSPSNKNDMRYSKAVQAQKIQSLEDQVKMLTQKINKMEVQNKKQTTSLKQLNFGNQQSQGLIKSQKREIQNLIQKNQDLQRELYICQHKLKQKQFELLLQSEKDKIKIDHEKDMYQQFTPKKQMAYSRNQMLNEGEIHINSRIDLARRGILSQKRSPPKHGDRNVNDKRIIELEMIKMTYQNQLAKQKEKYEALSVHKDDSQRKLRKLNEKYKDNLAKTQLLEREVQSLRKKLIKNDQSIKNYEKDAKILVLQIENLNQRYQALGERHKIENQEKQRKIKELITQNESMQRKNKRQWMQKDTQLINSTQKHQLKIVQLQSQINGLKQKTDNLKSDNQMLRQKYEKTLQLLQKNVVKAQEKQNLVKTLSQKLQLQKNEKEKIFNMFTTSTNQLSKLLEEKQIEIQELKFIQESTIINYHCQKNTRNSKKQNQSAYSFQQQF